MKNTIAAAARASVAAIALSGLMGGALDPQGGDGQTSNGGSGAASVPPIVVTVPADTVPAPPPGAAEQAAGNSQATAPEKKAATPASTPAKKPPAKPAKDEVLPWASAPAVATGDAATGNQAAAPAAPAAALPSPSAATCQPMFEAQCRDAAECAWVADVPMPDGTTVPAHCAGRMTPPPKKADNKPKKLAPKPDAAAVTKAAQPPATEKVSKPEAKANSPISVSPPAPIAATGAEDKATTAAGPNEVAEPASSPSPDATSKKEESAAPSAHSFGGATVAPGLGSAVSVTVPAPGE